MKKRGENPAFTVLELVFVIVVIGIISATAFPRISNNNLRVAADQVVSHIRYTQHLAMQDDKFDANDPEWFKGRWTIRFYENLSFTNTACPVKNFNTIWAYTIFSDKPGYTGNPNLTEMARNPQNPNQFLSGGFNNTLCVDNKDNAINNQSMASLRLNTQYGVKNVVFGGGCRSNVRYINFDYLGRPSNSFPNVHPYELPSAGWHKLLTQQCRITLSNEVDSITIAIEPETGYAHILPN
jgi:type II secretory pathway pseudopilin PulG